MTRTSHPAMMALLVLGFCCLAGCGQVPAWPASGSPVATPPIVTRAVTAASTGNFGPLLSSMTPGMASLVTPDAVQQIHAGFTRMGDIRGITTLRQPSSDPGTRAYHFTVHMARGEIEGNLLLDSAGQISGLRFLPPEAGAGAEGGYVAKGQVHLPFHGEWYAFWGGTDPAKNQP